MIDLTFLFCKGEFKKRCFAWIWTSERDWFFSTIKRTITSGEKVTVFVHNVRSFSKHVDKIVSDDRIIDNDVIGFTVSQINSSDSTCKIIGTVFEYYI